ncbi:hypothetical protein [Maritalea mediterranea]|uniref:Uncharacterized protein n=1 Tax=Maritalea mediterranea TaxID=2909667 RepID=A0ABS9E9W2_9HYPH|nr:hypothetical protein [Maritalea mediterranea]MCF4098699.1 hypothetical protein [Maritalea mediterranea]
MGEQPRLNIIVMVCGVRLTLNLIIQFSVGLQRDRDAHVCKAGADFLWGIGARTIQ